MFEKEAKERARKLEESQTLGVYYNEEDYERDRGWNEGEVSGYEEGFKDGAEFGYNKAKEEMQEQIEKMKNCKNCKKLKKEKDGLLFCTVGSFYTNAFGKNCDKWEIKEK